MKLKTPMLNCYFHTTENERSFQMPLKTYKAIFSLLDHDIGYLQQGIAIELEGNLFLVLSWLESIATRERLPEKLLPLLRINHIVSGNTLTISTPIPKAVFDGETQTVDGVVFQVVDNPAVPGNQNVH